MKIKILFILSFSLLFVACGSKKTTTSAHKRTTINNKKVETKHPSVKSNTKVVIPSKRKNILTQDYINNFSDEAMNQMRQFKIPASITLAQGILESRSGNSKLTLKSNNHFGIKCHKGWEGERTYYDDDRKDECFRVYNKAENSFNDHSHFLKDRKRYAKLFKLKQNDYKGWARGLRKAGYATDKKYPQKLITIIEKYKLFYYDNQVLGVKTTHDTEVYIVKKGDGLYGIARKFSLNLEDLKRFNKLTSNDIYPGQKLYLKEVDIQVVEPVEPVKIKQVAEKQEPILISTPSKPIETPKIIETPKPTQVLTDKDYHIVKEGEDLYGIAYKYDLSIPEIRKWNAIRKDKVHVGQRLFIKKPTHNKPVYQSKEGNAITHTVRPKETLYSISNMYKISVAKLMRLNNLKNYTIIIGQVLRIR